MQSGQKSSALEITPAPPLNLTRASSDLDAIRYDATVEGYNELPTYPVRPSYKEFHSQLKIQTQCVVFEGAPRE
jgi:hypothetical protein